ncbi:MAG: hypothetical protein PWQ57_1057 [Desulfovibrionales bacterium]|nr:hypothetical protein [Desulfovibrionales bacterium]
MPSNLTLCSPSGDVQNIVFDEPVNLAELLHLQGRFRGRTLCAGLGKCGQCKVRYIVNPPTPNDIEISRLRPREIEQGWRLACQRPAEPGATIQLPESAAFAEAGADYSGLDAGLPAAVAVDLGSTSLHWSVVQNSQRRACGAELNPQMGLGSEVMSRMAAALQGRGALLSRLVLDRFASLVEACPAAASSMAVAGNPAMIYLMLGLAPSSLAAAPYALDYAAGETRSLGPGLPDAYLPPLLGPFIGSDAACGALAVAHDKKLDLKPPFLLADLGTNVELMLGLEGDRFLAASAPMGPALEGAGLTCGRVAGPGVVTRFEPGPRSLRMLGPDAGEIAGPPAGVSGAGYLSLAALLRRIGLLDDWGRFAAPANPLGKALAANLIEPGAGPARNLPLRREPMLDLGRGLFLPASDMEEIVKVKAALNAGVHALLQAADLRPAQLTRILLAGALGKHVDTADLETLGFLPPGLAGLATAVGNTSLQGLELLLIDRGAKAWIEALPRRTRVLDLPSDPRFQETFASRLRLDYI